jgi:hypothetical protein
MVVLPKIRISDKQRLILYLLLIFVVILVFEGVYYLSLKVKKTGLKSSPSSVITPEINQKLATAHEKFKQEVLALQKQSPEPQATAAACLKEFFDPKTKANESIPVDPEKKIYDYGYDADMIDFGEIKSRGCDYWRVKFKARQGNKEYELLFPKGMTLTDKSLGNITGAIFKDHIGSEIQLRLRYQEISSGVWQLQEWNFLRFFIKN